MSLRRTFRPDNDARAGSGPVSAAAAPSAEALVEAFQKLHADHAAAFERSRALLEPAAELAGAVISTLRAGGKLLLCGNGGSAADSQHLAAEFSVRFVANRQALPAIALTTDSSALTAAGNDFGFDRIFARQVEALGRPGDLLIAFTTSGSSPNIVAALETARPMGLATACLTGRDGGPIATRQLADYCLIVPSNETARIQEVHIFVGHLICTAVDEAFAQG